MSRWKRIKQPGGVRALLCHIHTLPASWLSLSRSKRLLIVTLSYILGIAGLWILFPLVHNRATMFLPIITACWLFHYRGLIVSLVLNGIAFQITYYLLLRGMLPDQAFIEGGIIGFGTSLGLGLVVCWLRTAVELVRLTSAHLPPSRSAYSPCKQNTMPCLPTSSSARLTRSKTSS